MGPMFSSLPPSASRIALVGAADAGRSAVSRVDVLPEGTARHVPRGSEGSPGASATEREPAALADAIRDAALELGFARVGFCPIEPFEAAAGALSDWLAAGHQGEMTFMSGQSRSEPKALLPEA